MADKDIFEKLTSLAKRRGFIYQGSEIYGGLAGTWDYGPLGVELKRNLKNEYWKTMVQMRDDVVGVDAAIIMSPKVWEASGHLESFADPLVECKECHSRFRADTLIENEQDYAAVVHEFEINITRVLKEKEAEIRKYLESARTKNLKAHNILEIVGNSGLSLEEDKVMLNAADKILEDAANDLKNTDTPIKQGEFLLRELNNTENYVGFIAQNYLNRFVSCPACNSANMWATPKQFNLMVETYLGVVEGEKLKTYLRGEITQGVHVNFKNVVSSTRVKIPFGIAQIGKAFRNEITPGGFTFRSREFEQMELQFYVKPDDEGSMTWFEYWKDARRKWYLSLGMREENLNFKKHDKLAHYAKAAYDVEYNAGGEWKEMEGIHHRGTWDLSRHEQFSKQDMTYYDEETKERYTPMVIETSGGVDRATLFFLMDAYREEEVKPGEMRTVLKLHPKLAPMKAAVFPLLANKPELVKKARDIYETLRKEWMIAWDERGNIGKRYRAQDEAGTPYCITVDFDTLGDDTVTIRDRDSMEQKRAKISELRDFIASKLA